MRLFLPQVWLLSYLHCRRRRLDTVVDDLMSAWLSLTAWLICWFTVVTTVLLTHAVWCVVSLFLWEHVALRWTRREKQQQPQQHNRVSAPPEQKHSARLEKSCWQNDPTNNMSQPNAQSVSQWPRTQHTSNRCHPCWPCRTLWSTWKELYSVCSVTGWVSSLTLCSAAVFLSEFDFALRDHLGCEYTCTQTSCVRDDSRAHASVECYSVQSCCFSRRTFEKSELLAVCGKTRRNCKLSPADRVLSSCLCFGLCLNHVTSLCLCPGEVYEPSYYLLDENDKKVCLATGFSQYDQHKNITLFSNTTLARISGDSLFSQVAFNASEHNCTAGTDCETLNCQLITVPWRRGAVKTVSVVVQQGGMVVPSRVKTRWSQVCTGASARRLIVSTLVCVLVYLTVVTLFHRPDGEPGVCDCPRPAADLPQNHRLQRLPDVSALAQSLWVCPPAHIPTQLSTNIDCNCCHRCVLLTLLLLLCLVGTLPLDSQTSSGGCQVLRHGLVSALLLILCLMCCDVSFTVSLLLMLPVLFFHNKRDWKSV